MENSFNPKPPVINTDQHPLNNPSLPIPKGEPVPGIFPDHPVGNDTPQSIAVSPEQQISPSENIPPLENKATVASDTFLKQEKHGFLRSLGHVIRTAAGEFFTWFGGPMIPAGIALAAKALTDPQALKNIVKTAFSDPIVQARITSHLGADTILSTVNKLQPLVDATPILGAGVGIVTSAIGLLSWRVGSAIGLSSAKHGNENTQKLYQLGKIAELGAATLSVINPALSFLYPVAKGFSIAATFITHTKRP